MSTDGNVWAPGAEPGLAAAAPAPDDLGKPPDVVAVFTEVLEDLRDNFVQYLLAGLGYLLLALVLVVVIITVLVVFTAVPAIVLGAVAGEEAASLGALFGMTAGYALALVGVTAVTAPLAASMARSVKAHLDGEQPLGIGAMFTRAGIDIVQTVLLTMLTMAAVMVGMLFCYVPGLVAGLLLGFAFPALIVHRLSAVEAMRLSFTHAKDHFTWHLGYFGLGFAILLIAQAIPFIGIVLGLPVYLAYQIKCYERVFGSGPEPVIS